MDVQDDEEFAEEEEAAAAEIGFGMIQSIAEGSDFLIEPGVVDAKESLFERLREVNRAETDKVAPGFRFPGR
jgi:hypothetical protein